MMMCNTLITNPLTAASSSTLLYLLFVTPLVSCPSAPSQMPPGLPCHHHMARQTLLNRPNTQCIWPSFVLSLAIRNWLQTGQRHFPLRAFSCEHWKNVNTVEESLIILCKSKKVYIQDFVTTINGKWIFAWSGGMPSSAMHTNPFFFTPPFPVWHYSFSLVLLPLWVLQMPLLPAAS